MKKAFEIIEEIRSDCPVNPLTQLDTQPNIIERLRDYYNESDNGERAWLMTDLTDQLLNCIVSLSIFVPCDKNGVPLEKPIHIGHGIAEQAEADAWETYNEAQKSVIFEGWEVVEIIQSSYIIGNSKLNIEIDFDYLGGAYLVTNQIGDERIGFGIQSLADLAAATTENPLKLK